LPEAVSVFLEAELSVFDEELESEELESEELLEESEVDPSVDFPASDASVPEVPFFA
jgi:hypothetical protein